VNDHQVQQVADGNDIFYGYDRYDYQHGAP